MTEFLSSSGPWSQLVDLKNIELRSLQDQSELSLNERIMVTPFSVPHRDEFSETVGYRIKGKSKSVLFIPDIDKWQKWDRSILKEIASCDLALLDGTFFESGELPGRNMSEIPHPFVQESLDLFAELPAEDRGKVHFIHFNHTNRLLRDPDAIREIEAKGFRIAREGQRFSLE